MRKIMDAHTHAFVGKAAPAAMGVPYSQIEIVDRTEVLLREMNAHGVETAVILHSYVPDESPHIQAAVRKYPGRFVGFVTLRKVGITGKEAADYAEKWLAEPEIRGVGECIVDLFRVKGSADTIPQALNELRLLMDVVRAKKVPILFHTGFSGTNTGKHVKSLAWRDPLVLDEIAGEYWDVPIIIGHSGGHYPPYDTSALMMAYEHENVYLETSKSRSDVIEKAVSEIGASRLLFGTDWVRETPHAVGPIGERPSHMYDWNIDMVEAAKISAADKEMIFYGNMKSLLEL
ncbi:MAG: amidohydrolase family protein [Deltaproteobacteria bacterium]|jgi:predicted TIM-barrel fold metal-dependent hydrolase